MEYSRFWVTKRFKTPTNLMTYCLNYRCWFIKKNWSSTSDHGEKIEQFKNERPRIQGKGKKPGNEIEEKDLTYLYDENIKLCQLLKNVIIKTF